MYVYVIRWIHLFISFSRSLACPSSPSACVLVLAISFPGGCVLSILYFFLFFMSSVHSVVSGRNGLDSDKYIELIVFGVNFVQILPHAIFEPSLGMIQLNIVTFKFQLVLHCRVSLPAHISFRFLLQSFHLYMRLSRARLHRDGLWFGLRNELRPKWK